MRALIAGVTTIVSTNTTEFNPLKDWGGWGVFTGKYDLGNPIWRAKHGKEFVFKLEGTFNKNLWEFGEDAQEIFDQKDNPEGSEAGAIKSDGGSSSYYDIEVPRWLVTALVERRGEGKCFIKTEEINEILGNDFNYSTMFKSMVRAISIEGGVGKQGNTHGYECNKIRYYADRAEEKFLRKE